MHGDYVENAYIGRAVMDADIVISLTHFKAHDGTGFGGALKNLGMGCGSPPGQEGYARLRKARGGSVPLRGLRRMRQELRARGHHGDGARAH